MTKKNSPSEPSRTVEMRKLRNELYAYLAALGGFVWETPRLSNGAPTLHYLWEGQYYGFYPVLGRAKENDVQAFEQHAMRRLTESGAICGVVNSVDKLEEIMNLDIQRQRIMAALPMNVVVELLKAWGNGYDVPMEFQEEILRLERRYMEVLYGIYVDKYKVDVLAKQLGISNAAVMSRKSNAQQILRERLVTNQVVMEHVRQQE